MINGHLLREKFRGGVTKYKYIMMYKVNRNRQIDDLKSKKDFPFFDIDER